MIVFASLAQRDKGINFLCSDADNPEWQRPRCNKSTEVTGNEFHKEDVRLGMKLHTKTLNWVLSESSPGFTSAALESEAEISLSVPFNTSFCFKIRTFLPFHKGRDVAKPTYLSLRVMILQWRRPIVKNTISKYWYTRRVCALLCLSVCPSVSRSIPESRFPFPPLSLHVSPLSVFVLDPLAPPGDLWFMGTSVSHNKAVSNEATEGDLCVYVCV